MANLASIDIGSHTARLLITRQMHLPGTFESLYRRRAYIRLAEDLGRQVQERISSEAMDRTLDVLADFNRILEEYDVRDVHAIATGVVRGASNRDRFLDLIYKKTYSKKCGL